MFGYELKAKRLNPLGRFRSAFCLLQIVPLYFLYLIQSANVLFYSWKIPVTGEKIIKYLLQNSQQ